MAQGNEMNTVLVYTLAAVALFIVVMLAILLITIAVIRYKSRKQQQGKKGIYLQLISASLFERINWSLQVFVYICVNCSQHLQMANCLQGL